MLVSAAVSPPISKSPRMWRQVRPFYAIPAMGLTVLIMAYSGYFTPWSILIFYALWLPFAFTKGIAILLPPKGSALVLIYLALCFISLLWSDYPGVTFRAALEFATVIACSFVILRLVTIDSYIKGQILGIFCVLVASVAIGKYGLDPFGGTYTLIGLFGSKNQLGFFAELGLYLSILFGFGPASWISKIIYVPLPFFLSAYCLYASRSATSQIALAITLLLVGAVYFLSRIPQRTRRISFIAAVIGAIIFLALAASLGWQEIGLHLLGKDSTLTGRTYLWSQGYRIAMQDPTTGVGYSAFWVPGRLEAEQLWYQYNVPERSGFHFHNTFIEALVELGLPGLCVVFFWLAASLSRCVGAAIVYGAVLDVFLPLGICIALFVRSFVEVDMIGGFTIGTLLLIPILPTLRLYKAKRSAAGL